MGTAANMQVQPAAALFIGFSAGLLSTAGYSYIKVLRNSASIASHDS
jgi:ammonium transporter Rh